MAALALVAALLPDIFLVAAVVVLGRLGQVDQVVMAAGEQEPLITQRRLQEELTQEAAVVEAATQLALEPLLAQAAPVS
jgi:hypothetical protein